MFSFKIFLLISLICEISKNVYKPLLFFMNSKGFKNFNKTASSFNPNNININGRFRFGLILAGVLGYGLLNSIYYGNSFIYK